MNFADEVARDLSEEFHSGSALWDERRVEEVPGSEGRTFRITSPDGEEALVVVKYQR